MDNNLKKLMEIERELEEKLKTNPIFIQLQGIRNAISLFQNGNAEKVSPVNGKVEIPAVFDNDKLTWNEKVLFVLSKIEKGFVSDIVAQLQKAGARESEDFLTKRVSMTVFNLKSKGVLKAEMMGKKGVYYIA